MSEEEGFFCCFFCPSEIKVKNKLTDLCPNCKRPYGYPLDNPPKQIGSYKIIKVLRRGFYACTYLTEWGNLHQKRVLKVIPKQIYAYFKKNFIDECERHNQVAEGSEHIVSIEDYFDDDIAFGDTIIPCHIVVMKYIDGTSLAKIFQRKDILKSRTIAQIAIDLYKILVELNNKSYHHNDLHAGNILIQVLGEGQKRLDALDENIRAVAVDLGSISQDSRSNSIEGRLGDVNCIASHISMLARQLTKSPDTVSDLDYRIANLLDFHSSLLSPRDENQRVPKARDLIKDIESSFHQIRSPWLETLTLQRFDDTYNAQSLSPWFVPHLLVDPDGKWVYRISSKGPQIIVGMRGCGKTMLLRALQLHARATKKEGENDIDVKKRLENDGFVGLYVSCTRLLDTLGVPSKEAYKPYERLFIDYARQAIQAIRHMDELDHDSVSPIYHKLILDTLESCLDIGQQWSEVPSLLQLENILVDKLVSMRYGENKCSLKTNHPSHAFELLAETIKKSCKCWNKAYVLFLLDDVSTRFLQHNLIEKIISSLLFQSSICAFKLTTEAQTLELALKSPGGIEFARQGRDYEIFDLGLEVYEAISGKNKNKAKEFLSQILSQRAKYCAEHPRNAIPADILGDCTLISIARKIASTSENSAQKKEVYYGISSLANVCVGDIGDVISIYEFILRKAAGQTYPIAPQIQSECFQDFCTRRLFDLNRRKSDLKDFALSFAEASHQLLVESYQKIKSGDNKKERLRQYNKIYVRVTTGDTEAQFKQLRELIDAGVFVLHGGSQTPRTRTRDSDPIQQFILTYRKLFGLSNFIGLAERDRFELSGEQLERWLSNPADGNKILPRNIPSPPDDEGMDEDERKELEKPLEPMGKNILDNHPLLFKDLKVIDEFPSDGSSSWRKGSENATSPVTITPLTPEMLKEKTINVLVAGLGFEERTLESLERILRFTKPTRCLFIEYSTKGKKDDILNICKKYSLNYDCIDYSKILTEGIEPSLGTMLVDVTGLAKPAIFYAIRSSLKSNGKAIICHTRAKDYYPQNETIEEVLKAEREKDHYALIDKLKEILTGEKGPYQIMPLLKSDADESRRRTLFAFSSPKHERLLTLLDKREYDRIEIAVSERQNPRSRLAQIIGHISESNYGAKITPGNPDDLGKILELILRTYRYWYTNRGFNFECGLTGSKIEAIACSIASTLCKFSQCWYVCPAELDPNKFSTGVGSSTYYELALQDTNNIPTT
jgi:hypothetical protein